MSDSQVLSVRPACPDRLLAFLISVLTAILVPPAVAAATVSSVASGASSNHSCALFDDGRVKCWGDNSLGQLGLGDTAHRGDGPDEMGHNLPFVSLGTGRTATKVVVGDGHTCAILDNGTVKCWGYNFEGELGLGDTANRGDAAGEMGDNLPVVSLGTGRTAIAISAGALHTCALLDNATVKCWGLNHLGQLGNDFPNPNRGDGPGEMGDNIPAVSLGTGRTAIAITAGRDYNCAILDNGTVKCWGDGDLGKLGFGDLVLLSEGTSGMGDSIPAVELGTGRTATAIVAGESNTCVILDNGTVKCWGGNAQGSLGLGDTAPRGDEPGEMGDDLPVVPLGTGRTATAIIVAQGATCALLDNATVKCWGGGWQVVGLDALGDDPGEMGDNLPVISLGTGRTVTALAVGAGHACARLDNGTMKCWGANNAGQLGLGDVAIRGDDPAEMGDNLPAIDLGTTIASSPPSHLASVKAFPNPLQPALGHTSMMFSQLPAESRIRIYTLRGMLIKDLAANQNGMASWDGTNQSGTKVSSGVYFVYVQGGGQGRTLKVAVER